MNIAKKLYCRGYQSVFHFAIPVMPYKMPKRVDSIKNIPEVLKKQNKKHPLIVTDPGISACGLLKLVEDVFEKKGVPYSVYDKTVPNPTDENVAEALAIYKAEGCDSLVAIGGGSSIDCAKGIGACIARPDLTLAKMEGILKVIAPIPTLVAIPTTAGTGSETTLAAVITDAKTRHKYAINDFPLIPKYAVLDPKMTESLPPSLTATTGMDALTHAVEAFIGGSTTKETRHYARKAVRLIFENIDDAVNDGHNMTARRNMLYASFCAGYAFTQSYVGYVHAVAHSLGGEYNVPHGLANAIILPLVLEKYGDAITEQLYYLAMQARVAKVDTPKKEAARMFIQAIKDMKKRFNIPDTIPQIRQEDIPKLARYADKEANPLYPVPVVWDAKELESIYYDLMEK